MKIEPTDEQRATVFRFLAKTLDNNEGEVNPEAVAHLLAEREHALREQVAALTARMDKQETEEHDAHCAIYEKLRTVDVFGVVMQHDDGLPRLARDVVAYVDAVEAFRVGRNVVSLQTYRRTEEERDEARAREVEHLAAIATLRRLVEDRVDIGSEEAEAALDATAHYDKPSKA